MIKLLNHRTISFYHQPSVFADRLKMMVNQYKDDRAPWQSNVPQQMPWMSSYEPCSPNIQFGQQAFIGPSPDGPNPIQPNSPPITGYPTATASTSTSPVISCPTSIVGAPFNTSIGLSPMGVTTTTQSNFIVGDSKLETNPAFGITSYNISAGGALPLDQVAETFNVSGSLTHIPSLAALSMDKIPPHKRSSIEMEDEQFTVDEPPTKQLLSECRLFKKFGSLQIDGNVDIASSNVASSESDDSDNEGQCQASSGNQVREEFNRYVYLLFKDKKGSNSPFVPSSYTIDRLAREERDKLSKAVVLWNPPPRNNFSASDDEDYDGDDEEFRYSDHKDFLKASKEDSIIITEVTDDTQTDDLTMQEGDSPIRNEPDDIMLD